MALDGSLCEPLDLTELRLAMSAKTAGGTLMLGCESSRASMTFVRSAGPPITRQFLLEGETSAERLQLLMLLADELLALHGAEPDETPVAEPQPSTAPPVPLFSEAGLGLASVFSFSRSTLLVGPRFHLRIAAALRFFAIAEAEALLSFITSNLGALAVQSFGGAFGLGISQRWTALECAQIIVLRGGILRAEGVPGSPEIEKQTVTSPWIGPALSGTVSYSLSSRLRIRGSLELGLAISGAAVTVIADDTIQRYGLVGAWISASLAVTYFW